MPIVVQAQCTVRGNIINDQRQGITATCVLVNAKDSVIKSITSDSRGFFEIRFMPVAGIRLRADANGYEHIEKALLLSECNQTINIVLHRQKKLDEVTVTANKPLIEQKADRTIFNVENSIAASGGDAMDVLKKTPGVLVVNNEITVQGKGSVGIMLNGKLQQVSGTDLVQLLRSIPSGNLSKIEVITNPSAKYDAEGDGGLINLVTKKAVRQGINGSVTATYNRNHYNGAYISATTSYRSDKLNIFATGNIGSEAIKYENRSFSYYSDQVWQQEIDQYYRENSARIQLGSEYNLTKQSVIGITYSFNSTAVKADEVTNANIFNDSYHLDSMAHTQAHTDEHNSARHGLTLSYEWKIDTTGKKINVDADYYTQRSDKQKDFEVSHFLADETPTGFISNNRVYTSPSLTIRSVKADVAWPSKLAVFSFGAKAAFVNSGVRNIYETQVQSAYVIDTLQTNTFQYSEQTQAAYISGQRSFGKKWEVQAGLRAEHTHTSGYSPTLAVTNDHDYTNLFPSAYVQYTANDNNIINLSYSKRIKRPAYNALNPFKFYYSLNSYTVGNPDLQPSYINRLLFTYLYRSRYTFQAYGSYVANYWDRIAVVDSAASNTGFVKANIGRAWYYGASFGVTIQPAKWWEFHGSINGEYSDFKPNHYDNTSYAGYTGWIDGSNSFFLDKKRNFSAEISGYYHAPRQKDYKRWDRMSSVNVGVKAQLLDKNLIITFNIDDMFRKTFWYQTNLVNGTTEYSYDDEQSVRLAVTYKFGNKSAKARRQHNTENEELQRIN